MLDVVRVTVECVCGVCDSSIHWTTGLAPTPPACTYPSVKWGCLSHWYKVDIQIALVNWCFQNIQQTKNPIPGSYVPLCVFPCLSVCLSQYVCLCVQQCVQVYVCVCVSQCPVSCGHVYVQHMPKEREWNVTILMSTLWPRQIEPRGEREETWTIGKGCFNYV